MKRNDSDVIGAALSTVVDQPSRIKVPPRMVWLRGVALGRQRAAERSLRITRALSAAALLLVVAFGAYVALRFRIEPTLLHADQAAISICAVCVLGYAALQLIRSPR